MTFSGQKVTFGVTLGNPQKSLFSHLQVTLKFWGFRGVLAGQHFLNLENPNLLK